MLKKLGLSNPVEGAGPVVLAGSAALADDAPWQRSGLSDHVSAFTCFSWQCAVTAEGAVGNSAFTEHSI